MRDPDPLQGADDTLAGIERRRPGRVDHPNPELLPLLRGEYSVPPVAPQPAEDDLSAARGILFGVLLGVLFWVILLTGR